MDTITLLCNLQAEGPATLRRLRAHGCENLTELLELPLSRLAAALEADERTAERFRREARALSARCDEDALEPEEHTRATGRAGIAPPVSPPSRAKAPVLSPVEPPTSEEAPEIFAPAPPPSRRIRGTGLEPDLLLGMDEDWCTSLQAAGVHTLEILWETSAFELARKIGRPMTAVVDLQCEARRAMTRARRTGGPDPRDPGYTVIAPQSPPSKAVLTDSVEIPAPPTVPSRTTDHPAQQRSHRAGYPGEWTMNELHTGEASARAGGPFA